MRRAVGCAVGCCTLPWHLSDIVTRHPHTFTPQSLTSTPNSLLYRFHFTISSSHDIKVQYNQHNGVPTPAAPQVTLIALPTELQLAITNNLPWWGIYTLRLTCSRFYCLLPPPRQRPKLAKRTTPRPIWFPFGPAKEFSESFFITSNNLQVCDGCLWIGPVSQCINWHERLEWQKNNNRTNGSSEKSE